MVNLVGIWILLFAILVGWGLCIVWLLRHFGGEQFSGVLGTFQTAWLGYAGLQCFLQLASLGLAINNLAFALSCVPAIAGYALQRKAVLGYWRSSWSYRRRVIIVVAIVVVLMVVVVAYAACDHIVLYDTGLYHLQAVKWMTRYPAVPGLANLHMRFGYNNSVHLFAAYTDTLWEGVAAHIANGFLLALALGHWFAEIFVAHTPRGRLRQVYCLFTLPWLLVKLWIGEVPSLSTDLPLTIFSFVFMLELLSMPKPSRHRFMLPLTLIVALAAVAVTTKLGGAALLAITGVIVVLSARKHLVTRVWMIALALPTLLVLGWLVRGVILSGWLMYPVVGRLPLSWSVPKALAAFDYGNIQSWSRMWRTGPDVIAAHNFWWWFGPWLDGFRASREFMWLAVSCALLAWRAAYGRTCSAARAAGEWGAIAACLLGMLEWFTGAPDLRYGNFWFWMLPAVLFAPMVAGAMRDPRLRVVIVAFSIALVSWSGGFGFHETATVPKLWGRPRAPQRMTTTRVTIGPSSEVLVPAGVGEGEDRCFDEDLPCTPQGGIQIQRDPSNLSAGYLPSPR